MEIELQNNCNCHSHVPMRLLRDILEEISTVADPGPVSWLTWRGPQLEHYSPYDYMGLEYAIDEWANHHYMPLYPEECLPFREFMANQGYPGPAQIRGLPQLCEYPTLRWRILFCRHSTRRQAPWPIKSP